MTEKVWFVTGTSTGFGKALAKELLADGYSLVATSRDTSKLDDLKPSDPDKLLKVKLDVTDKDQIKNAVDQAIKKFGRINVLVNNAGYGYFGSTEESDQKEVRKMFDTNFWGANDVTLAVLPYMRKARSGRILTVTSFGGLDGFAPFSYYNASKFALEGLFKALRKQVEPFNIHVTNIEPGAFRTDWAGRSHISAEETIDDYTRVHQESHFNEDHSGQQDGDPALAVKGFIKVAELADPPVHYLVGKDAYHGAVDLYQKTLDEFKKYKEDSTHMSFGDDDYWN